MKGKEVGNIKNEDISSLQTLGKDEIIEKFYQLRSVLNEALKNEELFRQAFMQSQEDLKRVKANTSHVEATEYNNKWSWVNKIVFVLKKMQRPLLSPELIDFMLPHEPTLQYSRHQAQSFSAHLNKAVKYGRVLAYKLGGSRGFYYVLPEWNEDGGKLKKEYEEKIFLR